MKYKEYKTIDKQIEYLRKNKKISNCQNINMSL